MAVPNNNQFVHHPKDHGAIGPFLPAEPTPLCYCGLPAFVKQSRHPASAGRAFYYCHLKRHPPTLDAYLEVCNFYQWIEGDEMLDPSIMLFPYDPCKSVPYLEFVRWVSPPPNPLEMTEAEKVDAALRRLANPPKCNYGVSVLLTTLSQRGAFTAFCHRGLPDYVNSHESNLSLRLYAFCTYNVTLGTFVFCREGSHLVTLRSITMDPNRTGLLSMNLRSLKQALSHGHAQRCQTISANVASRLAKELFRLR
jgi:hypothetical protein